MPAASSTRILISINYSSVLSSNNLGRKIDEHVTLTLLYFLTKLISGCVPKLLVNEEQMNNETNFVYNKIGDVTCVTLPLFFFQAEHMFTLITSIINCKPAVQLIFQALPALISIGREITLFFHVFTTQKSLCNGFPLILI